VKGTETLIFPAERFCSDRFLAYPTNFRSKCYASICFASGRANSKGRCLRTGAKM
jgi:hypothetical protein